MQQSAAMAHIELSAELQYTEPCSADQTTSASDVATSVSERQQSGSSCSTSAVTGDLLPAERRQSRPSSVRSRAAFFEALNASPLTTSLPLSPTSPASSQPRPRSLVSRSNVGEGLVMAPLPSFAAGQELEMVNQGSQEQATLAGSKSLPVSYSLPLLSSPAVMRSHLSHMDIHHSSFSDIQPHITEPSSSVVDSALKPGIAMQQLKQQAVAEQPVGAAILQTHVAHPDEEGIELQEQGHAEMLQHAVERLQSELAERDKQSSAAASALACKTQECESLMRVVRELTESRSKLVCTRTNLAEKLVEIQHEYMRLMRVADLSRVVSKENVAKTAKVMQTLKQVQDESARQQHLIGYFKERNKNLKDENLELKERVCLLERLDLLSYSRDSVCMREFKLHALKETY